MEKISQMMDGELDADEAQVQVRLLTQDTELTRQWETYHLIRDVLRNDIGFSVSLTQRVGTLLDQEPTVLAPQTRWSTRLTRYTLPMAAAVAGIAVVGWLALNLNPSPGAHPGKSQIAVEKQAKLAKAPKQRAAANLLASRGMNEYYLLAHREFSPTAALQGGASLLRVSSGDTDSEQ